MSLHKLSKAPELSALVARKHKATGFLILGVQANPGDEFRKAITLANWWAREGGKNIKSFDILLFTPTDYHGLEIPLWQHTGFASFVALYYANTAGAFRVISDNAPFSAVPLSPCNTINPLVIR